MSIPKGNNPVLEQAAEEIMGLIMNMLESYKISKEMQMHYQRALRSMMYGFVAFVTHEEYEHFLIFPLAGIKVMRELAVPVLFHDVLVWATGKRPNIPLRSAYAEK